MARQSSSHPRPAHKLTDPGSHLESVIPIAIGGPVRWPGGRVIRIKSFQQLPNYRLALELINRPKNTEFANNRLVPYQKARKLGLSAKLMIRPDPTEATCTALPPPM